MACNHYDPDHNGECLNCDEPFFAHAHVARHDTMVAGGEVVKMDPIEVRRTVMRMVDEGEILAVLVQVGDDLAVQVFGPPSLKVVEALEQAVRDLRKVTERTD